MVITVKSTDHDGPGYHGDPAVLHSFEINGHNCHKYINHTMWWPGTTGGQPIMGTWVLCHHRIARVTTIAQATACCIKFNHTTHQDIHKKVKNYY